MRARNIKPGLYKNNILAKLSPLARILFTGLWCYADRDGKFEWNPDRIKVEILPYDKCDIDKLLMSLHDMTFIYRYEIEGQFYGIIPKFLDHQNPHPHEAKSKIPNPTPEIIEQLQRHGMSLTSQLQVSGKSVKGNADVMIPDIMNPDTMNPSHEVYDYYISKINPLQKSSKRAIKNISHWLKTFTKEELISSIDNYFTLSQTRDPDKRKDPANFFGKQDEYFKDYLPNVFKSAVETNKSEDKTKDPYWCDYCERIRSSMSRTAHLCTQCEIEGKHESKDSL